MFLMIYLLLCLCVFDCVCVCLTHVCNDWGSHKRVFKSLELGADSSWPPNGYWELNPDLWKSIQYFYY